MNEFIERLQRGPVLADGAMGTQLHAHGITFEHSLDGLNLTQPDVVLSVHRGYVEAGADLLETNTFGGNRFRLAEHDLDDKVAEINRSGVRLARKAADESRRQIYVAGSVGPVGVRLAPLGRVTATDAFAAFKEQITVLNEAGIDALIFETFSDLNEIVQAIKAAREVNPNLPLIAQMTFTEDGCTPLGDTPEQVARKLCELEVDVIGANCSVGPAKLLPVVQALARHAAQVDCRPLVSIQPNAGWPQRMGSRLIYPATPEYFGDFARRFLQAGAAIIGGCCGTTADHIRAMRAALDEVELQRSVAVEVREVIAEAAEDRSGAAEPIAPTQLAEKLAEGKFVTAIEVDPPRGHSANRLIETARELKRAGFDVMNIADTPMARMRMSAWALAHLIQRDTEMETVLHFPTRGRNLLRVQGDLLAAHALGIRNLLVMMGDPPSVGDYPEAGDQHDIVPSGLVKLIKSSLNSGKDSAGISIGAGHVVSRGRRGEFLSTGSGTRDQDVPQEDRVGRGLRRVAAHLRCRSGPIVLAALSRSIRRDSDPHHGRGVAAGVIAQRGVPAQRTAQHHPAGLDIGSHAQGERWPQGRDQDRARGAAAIARSLAGRVRDADVWTV